jgi:hypothetical protein
MKSIFIVVAVVILIITSGIYSFDLSPLPSENNEGIIEPSSATIEDSSINKEKY